MTPLQRLIEHARRQQHKQKRGIPSRQLDLPVDELMTVYESQSDFMRTLRAASSEILWASEREALEEWRSRTLDHWGYFPTGTFA